MVHGKNCSEKQSKCLFCMFKTLNLSIFCMFTGDESLYLTIGGKNPLPPLQGYIHKL